MSLEPLLSASLFVQVHAVAALLALCLGTVQLLRPAGDSLHRMIGFAVAFSLAAAALSSFGIHEINQWRGFSLIHLLSISTLVSLPVAVLAARHGNMIAHRLAMRMMFWTGLVIPGALTLLPGRVMHKVAFGE